MVAHNAAFDRRVLRQAFERVGLQWPDPPVICTAALARSMLPLQRERRLTVLADALGIEVHQAHRALADAETCARVLCALFPRLCANAATVADALQALAPRRRARRRPAAARSGQFPGPPRGSLPTSPSSRAIPGCTCFATRPGGCCTSASRSRSAAGPGRTSRRRWRRRPGRRTPSVVDYRTTRSELGALVLENRLIKELAPPGNQRLTRRDDRLVYIRCRLDIPYPILEVSPDPAAGHAVTIGPMRGRRLALELVEQLDSLFGLRHCGRRLPRREHPSAYGQMGRCLSPCLGDLDPNLYRRRLDDVLRLFLDHDAAGEPGRPLLDHVERQMRQAAARAALRARRSAAAPAPAPARGPRAPGRRAGGHPRSPAAVAGGSSQRCRVRRVLGLGRTARRLGTVHPEDLDQLGARTAAALALGAPVTSSAPTSPRARSTRSGSSAAGWPRTPARPSSG